MPAINSEHLNDFIVVQQTRPDPVAAPTGMVVPPNSKSFRDQFGNTIVPTSFTYLTQVSGDDRGETATTLTSTPVTISGSTYTHTLKVSDRTHGPFECGLTITGTGATTLSWLVNGRASGDSGTGASYQPGEYYFERWGLDGEQFHNPTRDGQTAVRWTPNGEAQFPYTAYPERDTRTHSGRSLYYSASGETFESCVNPMDFMSPEEQFSDWDGETSHGDRADRSALWYGHRCYQKIKLRWGSTDAVRAVTQRCDVWTYAPTAWDGANDSGPLVIGRFNACYTRGGHWDEAKVYDVTAMGSPLTLSGVAQAIGVSKFRQWTVGRKYIIDVDTSTNTVNSIVTRSPVASRYVAVVLRDSVTDVACALVTKLGDTVPDGTFLQPVLGGPDMINLGSFWDGAHATGAITEAYTMVLNCDSKGSTRRVGWIGHAEFRLIGLTAHVLAAISALYSNGDLDLDPEQSPAAAAVEGTVFPPPPRASRHANEWARYAQVRPDPTQAPTALTCEESYKYYLDENGEQVFPPATVVYKPATTDELDTESVLTSTVDGYTNTLTISNRLLGPKTWETTCPNGVTVSWLLLGNESGTGASMQLNEAYIERLGAVDELFSNPTQFGAGQSEEDPGFDPYRALRCYSGIPIYLHVDNDAGTFVAACHPPDFGGFGTGDAASQDHTDDETHPVIWYGHRFCQKVALNWDGSGVVHKVDYWGFAPTEWSEIGDSAPLAAWFSALVSLRPDYFDSCTIYDLARSSTEGGEAVPSADWNAPSLSSDWFRRWDWSRSRHEENLILPSGVTVVETQNRSKYVAIVLSNAADGFSCAIAARLGDTDSSVGTMSQTSIADDWCIIQAGQYLGAARPSPVNLREPWAAYLQLQSKSDVIRPAGWIGKHYFQLVGETADVLAALERLKTTGALDLKNDQPPPAEVLQGTTL